ncbi:hypothetical protein LZ518_06885 [Sphingomonas sp. RB56-2]|uniref:Uncharacterized protein n=1 Tax=Sphingomonas brevis TaxID=2908206 RepID=A0ABT0S9Q0_9SPHN|nr:hypothetical protein [Sphingomonas brevis]MCL6740855.1 hypothetical protein [Sphingomonas brevis]
MNSRQAFEAIENKIAADPEKRIVDSFYDNEHFGNFWITYDQAGDRLSVVNDRSQLFLHSGPPDQHCLTMLVKHLESADEQAILDVVP